MQQESAIVIFAAAWILEHAVIHVAVAPTVGEAEAPSEVCASSPDFGSFSRTRAIGASVVLSSATR